MRFPEAPLSSFSNSSRTRVRPVTSTQDRKRKGFVSLKTLIKENLIIDESMWNSNY
jgi:hypothetical protein